MVIKLCGCKPGHPPVCDVGRYLLQRETEAMQALFGLSRLGQLDLDRTAADARHRDARAAFKRHLDGLEQPTDYEAAERAAMSET